MNLRNVNHPDFRQERELSLRDLLSIYKKRRKVVFGTMFVVLVLAAVYCAVCTRRYSATGTVQIEKEDSSGLNLDDLMSGAGAGASNDMQTDILIATQASILKSDTLALRTIEYLRMENSQDFVSHRTVLGAILGLISPKGMVDLPGTSLEDAPGRMHHVLAIFEKNLTVKPIPGTRMIEIDYLNPDPKLASAVVNQLMQALADYSFQARYSATNQASAWLTGQLMELRKQNEDLQMKVIDLGRQSGVYSLGNVDSSGHQVEYSSELDRLQQDTAALTAAEQNLILRGAIAKAAEAGDAELLSGLAGPPMSGASNSSGNSSLLLIQSLRQQETQQKAALQEAETQFGSAYPRVVEMRANLASLERSIKDEVARIKSRAENDYVIAQQNVDRTRAQYEQEKQMADKLNDKTVEYMIMREEAEDSRGLYEDLLKRLKEAGVIEGLKSTNITVVDPGRLPAIPKIPNVPVYMLVALVGGFFLGLMAGLVVDTLDNKIGSIQEVEELTGQNLMGATPFVENMIRNQAVANRTYLTSLHDPQSTYAEAIRSIRTAVFLTGGGSGARVILVTSSIPGEGKTNTSTNLAVVLSQANRKVLLIDADLRRGRVQNALSLQRGAGLSELLAGQQEPVLNTIAALPLLDVLQSGMRPPNPADLLDTEVSKWLTVWREKYDFIVLDGPPLLPVTDAHILHPLADITLLITRSGLTERVQLQRSYRMLTEASKHFVGIILNGLRPRDDAYYGYYGYRQYAYHYGEDDNAKSN